MLTLLSLRKMVGENGEDDEKEMLTLLSLRKMRQNAHLAIPETYDDSQV
jgi:hypothetical protein